MENGGDGGGDNSATGKDAILPCASALAAENFGEMG